MKSFVLCRSYGINNHFVHPPWAVLLEGKYSEFFLQGSLLLTHDFVTVNKGRPKQEQASQPGGSCPDVLWYPHSHLLVGRHVLPADVSSFFSDCAPRQFELQYLQRPAPRHRVWPCIDVRCYSTMPTRCVFIWVSVHCPINYILLTSSVMFGFRDDYCCGIYNVSVQDMMQANDDKKRDKVGGKSPS